MPLEASLVISLPSAVIFDLDGTLLDNMPFHVEAFTRFLAAHGIPPMDAAARARFDGKRNQDIFPDLMGRPLGDDEMARLEDEKESLYRELSRGRLQALPGLDELLTRLERRAIPVAIATSAPAANVVHTIDELRLHGRFQIVRGDEVARGKPHPDIFLEAARRLGRAPAECLVFEDAPHGITAARAAGMTCVAVATSAPERLAHHVPPPRAVVKDFAEFLEGVGREI